MRDHEYMDSNSSLRYQCEEYARAAYGKRVAEQEEVIRSLRDRLQRMESYERKAKDFDVLLKAIKDDPAVKSYWDKIMLLLRFADA